MSSATATSPAARRRRARPPAASSGLTLQPLAALPRWALPSPRATNSAEEAAFAAGAALMALDALIRSRPRFLGCLCQRQALLCAVRSRRLLRLQADEAELRDAHHLTRAGDDPGPAGRLYRSWRLLARLPPRLEAKPAHGLLARLHAELGGEVPLDGLAAAARAALDLPGSPAAAAAEMARLTFAHATEESRREARAALECLGLMLADAILAARLGWPVALPLLGAVYGEAALQQAGKRVLPSDGDWTRTCSLAIALAAREALQRALDLSRRADRLMACLPSLRSKGGLAGAEAILDDDAVAPWALAASTGGPGPAQGLGSDRAARRFLDRLVALGGLRLLTSRQTFRLYGL